MARTAAQEFKDIVTAYRDDIEARNKAIIDAGIGIYADWSVGNGNRDDSCI